jgi:DedD protein
MDHELKQRLIGAVVITALAAIFIPMLFDDPADTSASAVTDLAIPQPPPTDATLVTAQELPANKEQVLNRADTDLAVSEGEEVDQTKTANDMQAEDSAVQGQDTQPDMSTEPTDQPNETPGSTIDHESGQNIEPEAKTGVFHEPNQDLSQPPKANHANGHTKKPKPVAKTKATHTLASAKHKLKSTPAAEKSKMAAKSQKSTAQQPNSKLQRYILQAGSFKKKENAQALVEKLRKQGFPASVDNKGEFFRVKVGPELDKNKAKEMRAKLDKQNISSLLMPE